eukprot:2105077-Rhodomonas_salina.1
MRRDRLSASIKNIKVRRGERGSPRSTWASEEEDEGMKPYRVRWDIGEWLAAVEWQKFSACSQ